MRHTENRPPGVVPLKARYMGKDIKRLAEYYHIPLSAPAVSVKNCSYTISWYLVLTESCWGNVC